MWKKMVLLFLIALPLAVASVSAADVILVSDNSADQCTALEVADALNATVVTTEWGIYNESIVSEIESLNPEKVIIIGGPLAVVENYTTALESAGIIVERIGGSNRYETNANVTLKFQNQLKYAFGNNTTACVCYGFDDIALNETMQKLRNRSCLVLLTNGTNLSVDPQRLQIRLNKVEIIENPICPFCNYSKIMVKLQRHGLNVTVEKIPEERVKLMLENKIRVMERKIERLKRMGINVTDLEEQLKEIEQLMYQNKYQEAYMLMLQLQDDQMFKVRMHMHPMWKGMESKKGEKAPHIYHKNVNNMSIINNSNNITNLSRRVGGPSSPHIDHQRLNFTTIDH